MAFQLKAQFTFYSNIHSKCFKFTSVIWHSLTPWLLPAFKHNIWLVNIMKCSLVKPIMMKLWECSIPNLLMRLFFLRPSLIGLINDMIFILTNQQVVLRGFSFCCPFMDPPHFHDKYKQAWYTSFLANSPQKFVRLYKIKGPTYSDVAGSSEMNWKLELTCYWFQIIFFTLNTCQ